MKICSKCKLDQEESNFAKNKNSSDGLYHHCRICKRHYDQNRPNYRKITVTNKICLKCNRNRDASYFWKDKKHKDGLGNLCKDCAKYRQYKITMEDFLKMKKSQEDKCAICGKIPSELHIDHDHKTGEVRGLLCEKCNLCLGRMQDTLDGVIDFCNKAIKYLDKGEIYKNRILTLP